MRVAKKTSILFKIMFLTILFLAIVPEKQIVAGIRYTTCAAYGCEASREPGGSYCYKHTCHASGCTSRKVSMSEYCSYHKAQRDAKKSSSSSKRTYYSVSRKICSDYGCEAYCEPEGSYCYKHTCHAPGCTSRKISMSEYCSYHKAQKEAKKSSSSSVKKTTTSSSSKKSKTNYSSKKGKSDTYDVHSYKDAESFADDKYEEFYDYEDDYDDEDEAYDAAEEYWYDNY